MSWMSSRRNACRSGSIGNSSPPTSSTSCPASSSSGACRSTSGRIMAPSSLRRRFRTGSPPPVQRLPTSSRVARGRMVTSRASTPASVMSFSMARSSTPSLKPASSWKAGGASTTLSGHTARWATGPQPRRSSFRSPRGRLRYPDRLRRPRWRPSQSCTHIQAGPLVGGRSIGLRAISVTSFTFSRAVRLGTRL